MQISRTNFIQYDTNHKTELYSYLYGRHLEDASFLYYLGPKRLNNPDIPWTTMMDEEKRFLSLINGLIHGQTIALGYCLDHRDAKNLIKSMSLSGFCVVGMILMKPEDLSAQKLPTEFGAVLSNSTDPAEDHAGNH